MSDYTGKLLVASPGLNCPAFSKKVVLVIKNLHVGSLGVVINESSPESVNSIWKHMVEYQNEDYPFQLEDLSDNTPKNLNIGGPVVGPFIMVHDYKEASESKISSGLYYATEDKYLIEAAIDESTHYRLFQGYSGWAGGQLEYEIKRGDWLAVDSNPDYLFNDTLASEDIWKKGLSDHAAETYRSIGLPVCENCELN